MTLTSDFIVSRFGENVTITTTTRTYDDADNPREPTETSSTTTVRGLVQWASGDEEAVKSGLLQIGDAVLFVPVSTTISNECRVTYDGTIFRVIGKIAQNTVAGTHYKEVHLRKMQ